MDAEMMKLIAYGKVMDDDSKTIKDFSLKDGDQIVVMISKVIEFHPFNFMCRQSHNLKISLRIKRKMKERHKRLNRMLNQFNKSSNSSNNQRPNSKIN